MEKNPKKSRALIITFIIMLLLLGIFYLLVIKNNPFTTKGTTTENRSFFSLFSKLKNKDLSVIDDAQNNNVVSNTGDDSSTNAGNQNSGNNTGGVNIGDQNYIDDIDSQYKNTNLKLRPIPTPDYDPADFPKIDSSVTKPILPPVPDTEKVKQCNLDDYKLKFTDAEQAELDKLLRDFYRIASSIKTEEDIDAENEARLSYISLANEAKELTKQCYEQTSSPKYMSGYWANTTSPDTEVSQTGQLISTNFSKSNQARLERKPNPWYGTSGGEYFYTANVFDRSVRFAVASYVVWDGTYTEKVWGKLFDNSVQAEQACLDESKNYINSIKNLFPSNYILSADCAILEGQKIETNLQYNKVGQPATLRGIYRGLAWYSKANSQEYYLLHENTNEWFFDKPACELRNSKDGCYQSFLHEQRSGKDVKYQLPRVEWVYSVDVRSKGFKTLVECESASKASAYKIKMGCKSNASEGAYINKIWNENIGITGYNPPINYAVFENLFNIW